MASAGSAPPLMRQINCTQVLATLRGGETLRLSDIAERSGLSRPTVGQVVEQLQAAGLVTDAKPDARSSRAGRPPRMVRFRSEAAYVVGVDIGRHKVLVIVADLLGNVLTRHRRDTSSARGAAQLLAVTREAITGAIADAEIAPDRVASLAVGTPGIVDTSTGTVTMSVGMPEWTVDLASELKGVVGCQLKVENDVNLAALAERWYGVARTAETVVYVLWGERVGAGILIGDRLHRGYSNAAGEIGCLVLEPGSTPEPDEDGLGPFDRMVGAGAIAAAGRRASTAALFGAAAQGDPDARAVVDEITSQFARGLAPMLALFDPGLLVIGGGVSQAGTPLLDAVREKVNRLTLVRPRLALSALGDEAVALGAVRVALRDAEQRLLPVAGLPATATRPITAALAGSAGGPPVRTATRVRPGSRERGQAPGWSV